MLNVNCSSHGWCPHLHPQSPLLCLPQHSDKLQLILDIWSSGRGVMSLHLFHNTTAQEAFTREACMIEAIGRWVGPQERGLVGGATRERAIV